MGGVGSPVLKERCLAKLLNQALRSGLIEIQLCCISQTKLLNIYRGQENLYAPTLLEVIYFFLFTVMIGVPE